MPLTSKGEEILKSMEETYGSEEKAKQVLYASKNVGKITGIDEGEEGEEMADQQVPGVVTPTAPEIDRRSQDQAPYKEIAPAGSVSVPEMWRAANEHRQPEQQLNTPDRSKVGDIQPKEGIARLFDR